MKKLILVSMVVMAFNAKAQQLPLTSQYMFNDLIINPAVAGSKDDALLSLSFRKQWAGINEAPISQTLSGHTYLGKGVGIGGLFINDSYGPSRITGVGAAVSYMFPTSEKTKLSFGLNPNFTQFTINRNRLITEVSGDNAIANATYNGLVPDMNFGVLWFSNKFHFGLTGVNLIQTKKDLFDVGSPVTSTIDRMIYINGAYKFSVAEKFEIEPSVLFRYIPNAKSQMDANVRFIYAENYWLGFSYRTNDAATALLGLRFNRFIFGYSYDYTLTDLATFNTGTHELFLSLKLFSNKNKSPWQKRNRIYSTNFED